VRRALVHHKLSPTVKTGKIWITNHKALSSFQRKALTWVRIVGACNNDREAQLRKSRRGHILYLYYRKLFKQPNKTKQKMKRSSRRWKKKGQMRWKWQRKRMKKEKRKRMQK